MVGAVVAAVGSSTGITQTDAERESGTIGVTAADAGAAARPSPVAIEPASSAAVAARRNVVPVVFIRGLLGL